MKIRLYLLSLFFIAAITANAETFTVISNADSGPGTLRAALTAAAANGILFNDLIEFNLPGSTETDRTILLLSELPLVTRGIVLDATTQPGPALGSSPAKILIRANRLMYQASAYDLGCFNIISTIDVEIYGFAFDQFESLKVSTNPNGQGSAAAAIYVRSSSGITIGAPGKGNVFMQNSHGITGDAENYIITNFKMKVQSNWFGLNSNGMEIDTKGYYYARILANNSEFGGTDLTYANIVAGYSPWGLAFQGTNLNIRFNRFGYLGDGKMANRVVSITLNTTLSEFTDNEATRFVIKCQGKNIKILRNKEFAVPLSTGNNRIELYYAENIQIGNDNIADANEFLKNDFGPIANFGSKNVEVRKNIIHCTPYAYGIVDIIAPAIQVLINKDTEYSGTAAPNSEVYIYNDYTDCASCSPLQFYTKLVADANGKWGITGDFSNNKFIANTTLLNVSSEFTQPHILTGSSGYWYNKKDPTCGESNGTLELAKTAHLLKIEWYNANNEKVGEGLKVEHLPPGEYYAKGYNGKCYTISPYRANLFNVEPKIVATGLNYKNPGCGLKNGYIKGLYYTIFGGAAVTYKWINENNEVMTSSNTELNNAGPGSYTFVVSTPDGCATAYGPIVLENTDGPNIDRTAVVPANAHCDLSDGSIVGAKATGIGNIQFTWKDENNIPIRYTADLTNVKAGKYTLEVKDESACGIISTRRHCERAA